MSKKRIMLWLALAIAILGGCRKRASSESESSSSSSGRTNPAAPSAPAGWLVDFAAAKQKAAEEGKDLFVLFTGSDWCAWCKRLDKEVFSKPGAMDQISQMFVPVYIDFPANKSGQSRQLQEQNNALADAYRIQGFPTVLLMDATGKPYAETGYQEGGLEAYLAHLKALKASKK